MAKQTSKKSKPSRKSPSKPSGQSTATAVKSARAKVSPARRRLPNVWQLTKTASQVLGQDKPLFIGIAIVYGLLSLILVQGLAKSGDVSNLKVQIGQSIHGQLGAISSSLSLFVNLLGSSASSTSAGSSAYQFFLGVIASLATIWAMRQIIAGSKVKIRDAYYRGMYPLVPFILVLTVIGLELLPLLIGATIYSLVMTNGIAVLAIEKILWALAFAGLALLSLYLVSSSILALYIVTLADMTPLKALRSARQLVKKRRWLVMRKLLFLPLALVVSASVIMLPVLFWMTPLTAWVFYALTILALTVVHAYIYTLYRELLND